jgi:hypothetical protein
MISFLMSLCTGYDTSKDTNLSMLSDDQEAKIKKYHKMGNGIDEIAILA